MKGGSSVPLLEYYCHSLSLLFSLLILIWLRFVSDPLGARRLKFEASDGISDGYDASQPEGKTRCSLFGVRETGHLIFVLLHSLTANSHVTTPVCAPTYQKYIHHFLRMRKSLYVGMGHFFFSLICFRDMK